jgi:hypothetical protein
MRTRGFDVPRLATLLLAAVVLALAGRAPVRAQAPVYSRPQVEAAYLLNFIRYTAWPVEAAPPPEAPLVVVVYRAPATADALEAIAAEERVSGREVEVRRAKTVAGLDREILGAHVLFVGEEADAGAALARVGDFVLTVGAAPRFGEYGGMFALASAGSRVVFDANLDAIRASGLSVSARVLQLARHVERSR